MRKYDLIIFDVDGTMLDTSEGILSAAKYAITSMNYEIPSPDVLRTFIGPPIQDSFAKTFNVSGSKLSEMTNIFRDQYKNKDLLKAVPYKGIIDVFAALDANGYKVAVATYKRQDYAETIVKHFGFDKYTKIICGSDFAGKFKKSDIINNSLEMSGVTDKSKAVMVGDTVHDASGSAALGLPFIGVTYGFGFTRDTEIKGSNVIGVANTPTEIISIVRGR